MYYKLYLDSLFVQQMLLNLYMLALVRKVLKCTATHFRIFLGAFTGTVITCLFLIVPAGSLSVRLYGSVIPASVCMLFVAFRCKGKMLLRAVLTMSAGCFFAGNLILWLLARIGTTGFLGGRTVMLALTGCVSYRLLGALAAWLERRRSDYCRVWIPRPDAKTEVRLKALVDTGNSLVDPISERPVSLISEREAAAFAAYMVPERYHAIPYHSVGKENGILNAYEFPVVYLEEEGRRVRKERVLFAVCNTGIQRASLCQIILHPRLLAD